MAIEIRLVGHNWGYGMISNDAKLLNIAPVPKYKLARGFRGMLLWEIFKFRSS